MPVEARGHFLGTCDGLFCYLDMKAMRICVWNPSLRISKTLDLNLSKLYTDRLYTDLLFFWFGRESSDADEYKVVLGVRSLRSLHKNGRLPAWCIRSTVECTIHTFLIKPFFSDDCISQSTQLEISNFYARSSNEGILLAGIVHWLFADNLVLLTYDLGRKAVGELSAPPGLNRNGTIGVIDGCFSAIYDVSGDFSAIYEVWVMKEYGVAESWTKFAVISSLGSDSTSIVTRVWRLKFVGVSDEGDLVLSCYPNCELLLYNVAENKSKIVKSRSYEVIRMYVDTLVFPLIMHPQKRLRLS
ncbi:hypothetical protein ACP275_07G071900 [Erythranthe tilingii]